MKLNKKAVRIVVIIAVVVVVAVAVWLIAKHIKKAAADREKRRDYAQLAVEIENAGGRASQLTSAMVETIAARIHDAVDGWGTDEDKLVASIESIPTAADYLLVKAQYLKDYGADMWDDITDDVDDDWSWGDAFSNTDAKVYGQIVAHLNLIDVPENIR